MTDEQIEALYLALADEGWEAPYFSRSSTIRDAGWTGEEYRRRLTEQDQRANERNLASLHRALEKVSDLRGREQ